MRPLLIVACFVSTSAWAETPWAALRGRVAPRTRIEAFVGTRSAGLGFARPDHIDARAAWAGELAVGFIDRTADLRTMRVWQVTPTQGATASVVLGGSVTVLPVEPFDIGVGPHAGLILALGGSVLTFDLSLSTGAELFVRTGPIRAPWRAGVGLHLTLGQVGVSVQVRGGVDFLPGQPFVGRGEAMVGVQWLGLDALRPGA